MHKIAIFGQSGASKDKKKASDCLEAAAYAIQPTRQPTSHEGPKSILGLKLGLGLGQRRNDDPRGYPRVSARNCHLPQTFLTKDMPPDGSGSELGRGTQNRFLGCMGIILY